MSTRQLAALLGTSHSAVVALEKREAQGKASLEMVQRAAEAMECKLVYAIVPKEPGQTLDDILTKRARAHAAELLTRVEHSMKLERQGSDSDDSRDHIERLASELKRKMDSAIWDSPLTSRRKGNQ